MSQSVDTYNVLDDKAKPYYKNTKEAQFGKHLDDVLSPEREEEV